MNEYFLKFFRSRENITIKVDLSNYATKADIKNITHVYTSNFALKTNLANSKIEVDELNIDKLVPIPPDLSKLSNVVKNDVVKKIVFDKLVAKVNNIDSSDFVLKTNFNTKISELENKIPDISNLTTKTALTIFENKIPSTSNLIKKTDYDTKITEIEKKLTDHKHDECVDTSKFNTLATNVFNTRIAQANLITKTDFDSSYFIGKSHFEEDGTQNYLVFQPMRKYFTFITNTDYVSSWKSKGLSDENIKPLTTSDNSLGPAINNYGNKIRVKLARSCLKQSNKLSYTHGKVVNIYTVYGLGASSSHINDPTLKYCLFRAATLTKNADIDKYGYSGYGIGFDRRSSYSFPSGGFGQNVLIFGVDMSSFPHINNNKKTF